MYKFAPGSQSVTIYVKVRDSTSGNAKTGLTATSAGATFSYTRQSGSVTPITLTQLAGPTAAWTSGGFVEMDATNAPGVYRIDLPNASLASGVPFCVVSFSFTQALADDVLVRLETPTQLAGSGAITWIVTVNNSNSGQPIMGAAVWISTDSGGSNVIAGTLYTNALGQATFYLAAGNYYVWVADPGYTGTNPTPITVS